MPKKTIILIRHGESLGQTSRKRGIRRNDPSLLDADLSRKGESQAKALKKWPSLESNIELVVVSPLTRALRTAALGFGHLDTSIPFICYPGLKERNAGKKGIPENIARPVVRIQKENPKLLERISFNLLPNAWPETDVFSSYQLQELNQWLLARPETKIVLVCHHNIIRSLVPMYQHSIINCSPIVCTLDDTTRLLEVEPDCSNYKTAATKTTATKTRTTPGQAILARKLETKTQPRSRTIRLSICERPEQKKASFVRMVEPNSKAIAKAARNKFKQLKRVHQLVLRRVKDGKQLHLKEGKTEPSETIDWLQNGDVVYIGLPLLQGDQNGISTSTMQVTLPPSLLSATTTTVTSTTSITPTSTLPTPTAPTTTSDTSIAVTTTTTALNTAKQYFANTKSIFPILYPGQSLKAMRQALVAAPGDRGERGGLYEKAIVSEDVHGLACFDYRTAGAASFPDLNDATTTAQKASYALRLESRGLIVDRANGGRVVARRFHKFFNVGERRFTRPNVLPSLTDECIMLEKLDGCLTSPLLITDQQHVQRLKWATKTTLSDELEQFVHTQTHIQHFSMAVLQTLEATPIFEWCKSTQPIVIRHATDSLTLIAIRHMKSGTYLSYSNMFALAKAYNVPCVLELQINFKNTPTLSSLVTEICMGNNESRWTNREGVVLHWPKQGIFVKIKTNWYISQHGTPTTSGSIHGSVGNATTIGKLCKRLLPKIDPLALPMVLLLTSCLNNELDDIIAFVDRTDEVCADLLRTFESDVMNAIEKVHSKLARWAIDAKEKVGGTRKSFADTIQAIVYGTGKNSWTTRTLMLHADEDRSKEAVASLRLDLLNHIHSKGEHLNEVITTLQVVGPDM